MIDIVRQRLDKAIRDNHAVPVGIQDGGPQRVMIFFYRGIDMAMYVDEINYESVRDHIEKQSAKYSFPRCSCGTELPISYRSGMLCVMCLRYGINREIV